MPVGLLKRSENLLALDLAQGRHAARFRCARRARACGAAQGDARRLQNFGREFGGRDAPGVGEQYGALQTVAQLAHVAGPSVSAQSGERVRVDVGWVWAAELLQEIAREWFDIVRAFAQRREVDLKTVDAIEQVGA